MVVAVKSPPKEVVGSSLVGGGDSSFNGTYTLKQQEMIRQVQALARDLQKDTITSRDVAKGCNEKKCPAVITLQKYFGSFDDFLRAARLPTNKERLNTLPSREQALAYYRALAQKLGRLPSMDDVNEEAKLMGGLDYKILRRLGGLKEIRKDLGLLPSDECADCEKKKPIAMLIENGQGICQKCYRARTGKSQSKYGICPHCHKGPRLISYRHPVSGMNICKTCHESSRARKPRKTSSPHR